MKRNANKWTAEKRGLRVKIIVALRGWLRRVRVRTKIKGLKKEVSPPAAVTRSLRETSEIIGLHPSTLYRLVARKMIVPVPGLRHLRFTTEEIDRFLNGGNRRG